MSNTFRKNRDILEKQKKLLKIIILEKILK